MSDDCVNANLLFVAFALRNEFVEREDLAGLLNDWSEGKERRFADWLVARGYLSPEDRAMIQRQVDQQLAGAEEPNPGKGPESLTLELSDTNHDHADGVFREVLTALVCGDGATLASNRRPSGQTSADCGNHQTLDSPSQPGRRVTMPVDGSTDQACPVGRFSVIRSHAKGGLGEVYLAHDHELGREVALKEIQHRFSRDRVARGRFELEACITGGLEHPGVVPVYAFGRHPDGRPFYAMRFIRGESLKEEIAQFHRSFAGRMLDGPGRLALHRLLRKFTDACNAIAYAHSRGILHRDIKPANIMVGKYGETLVVDWGLAKPVGRDEYHQTGEDTTLLPLSDGSSPETLEGSTLGTPAYMSPEQAAGRIDALGPASDIFSLGSTLYTLLAGTAAFEGNSATAIIAKVRDCRFVPPQQVNPVVPRSINAICLKAMSAEPDQRYATALALAADIENFLSDEPVTACRETSGEQFRRWLKRNRTLASVSAALLLTLTVTATIGWMLVSSEQRRTRDALTRVTGEELKTRAALELVSAAERRSSAAFTATHAALNMLTDDFVSEMLARNSRLPAFFRSTARTGNGYLRCVEDQSRRSELPTSADSSFVQSVIGQYESLARSMGDTPEAARIRATGFRRVGNLQRKLENDAAAIDAYGDAESILTTLLESLPGDPDLLRDLASVRGNLGLTLAAGGRNDDALPLLDSAAALLEQVMAGDFDRPPSDSEDPVADQAAGQHRLLARRELGRLISNRGNLMAAQRNLQQAEADWRDSMALLDPGRFSNSGIDCRRDLARVSISLGGLVSAQQERAAEALPLFSSAIAILEEAIAAGESPRQVRLELAVAHYNFGSALSRSGRVTEALPQLRKSVEIANRLVEEFPAAIAERQHLARNRFGLARVLAAINDPEASDGFVSAIDEMDELAMRFPENPQFGRDLAGSLEAWGLWATSRDPESARTAMNRAVGLRRKLTAQHAEMPELGAELLASEINLANFEREAGNWATAARSYQNLLERAAQTAGLDPAWGWAIDFGLGDSLVHVGDHAGALVCWERLCADRNDPYWKNFELQRAICLTKTGRRDEGVATALDVAETMELPPALQYDVACCLAVAAGLPETAAHQKEKWLDQGLGFLEKAAAAGFFDDEMKAHAATDPDLTSFISHPPFQAFCEQVGIEIRKPPR